MAGFVGTSQIAETSTTTSAKTMLQLVAAANTYIKLKAWGIYFVGISPTAQPIQVEIVRQSTAGTSSAGTIYKKNDTLAATMQTTSRIAITVEPTTADILYSVEVQPQTWYEKLYPLGDEPIVGGSNTNMRIGIRVTAAVAVNVRCWMEFEE